MSWLDTLEDVRTKDFSKAPMAKKDKAARDVVNMASYGCAVVAVSPIPFSDAALSLPMQTAMVMTLGHIYGRKVTKADAASLVVELGTVAGAGLLARQGIKALLPVVGALLTVPAAYAMNWGIGRVAMEYFKDPAMPKDQLKKIFATARDEGSKLFSMERFTAFRKKAAPEATKPASSKKPGKPSKPSKVAKLVDELGDRLSEHPDVRRAVPGRLHLDITGKEGGQWTADLTKDGDFIATGFEGTPLLTVRCSANDFSALMKGRTDPQTAVLKGALELTPMDVGLVVKLAPLFS